MRKTLATIALLALPLFAQVGIVRSTGGIHVPSAKTLEQGLLFVSGTFEMVSDGKPLSMEGFYTDENGEVFPLDENTPSNDEAIFASFALLDNLELGIRVPLHYDGEISKTHLNGMTLGDIQLAAKGYIPINDWLHLGLSGEIITPTGSKSKGFRPRHRWHVDKDGRGYAYSADSWVAIANGFLSMEFKNYLVINSHVGFLKSIQANENYFLWGGGFQFLPKAKISFIFEASGELPLYSTDFGSALFSNPFRLTPGLQVHLPYETYLTISGDVGLNYFKKIQLDDGLPVSLRSENSNIRYTVSGSPQFAIAVSISKVFDFSWGDDDNDGVINRKDMCPGTALGLKVNSRGCPVDEDQDGVLNIVDLCPGTPLGVEVDFNGCPLDEDHDGVYDYLDQCPHTPEGFAVDSLGCTLDSDGDGIDDNNDKCPDTSPGDKVGSDGCPLDEDHDGVPNDRDLCPGTPKGIPVDEDGCPLDFDGDGIPDIVDLCPNTRLGERVDSTGCPIDSDHDGVPDIKDLCPDTPLGVSVDFHGCRLDQDEDGIFDEDDQCPYTPKGAPVDSVGCPIDSDNDGIADWADKCPGTTPGLEVDESGCPTNPRFNFNLIAQRIHFKGADTLFVNSSYTALNDIVYAMRQFPIGLEIQCSANDVAQGDAMAVAQMRAQAIFNYLSKKGIREEKLKYQGFSGRLPPTLIQKNGSSDAVRLIPLPENFLYLPTQKTNHLIPPKGL